MHAHTQVPQGATPRSLHVHLRGALTRCAKPGDAVTISGIFLPQPLTGFRVRALAASTPSHPFGDWRPCLHAARAGHAVRMTPSMGTAITLQAPYVLLPTGMPEGAGDPSLQHASCIAVACSVVCKQHAEQGWQL